MSFLPFADILVSITCQFAPVTLSFKPQHTKLLSISPDGPVQISSTSLKMCSPSTRSTSLYCDWHSNKVELIGSGASAGAGAGAGSTTSAVPPTSPTAAPAAPAAAVAAIAMVR